MNQKQETWEPKKPISIIIRRKFMPHHFDVDGMYAFDEAIMVD